MAPSSDLTQVATVAPLGAFPAPQVSCLAELALHSAHGARPPARPYPLLGARAAPLPSPRAPPCFQVVARPWHQLGARPAASLTLLPVALAGRLLDPSSGSSPTPSLRTAVPPAPARFRPE
uniref:Uncharacterized protein n=1 Tax=Zea mays TaxID=4577 RepID=B4FLZ2_MAIZE|nr:unknown [Zea mays]|eukprot:NP_001137039.1 uncharacterized protein LOC100217210 [Zea mays]